MGHGSGHNLTLVEMDKRFFFHPATSIADHLANGPRIIERAGGVHVYDSNGRTQTIGLEFDKFVGEVVILDEQVIHLMVVRKEG